MYLMILDLLFQGNVEQVFRRKHLQVDTFRIRKLARHTYILNMTDSYLQLYSDSSNTVKLLTSFASQLF